MNKGTSIASHLFGSLSPAMQRELLLCVLSDTMLRFPLFRNTQRSFVADLAQVQRWEHTLTGDLVADEGQGVHEVVFLLEGQLQANVNPHAHGKLDMHINDLKAAMSQARKSEAVLTSSSFHSASHSTPLASLMSGEAHDSMQSGSSESPAYPSNDSGEKCKSTLRSGAWFGEASLFDDSRVYTSVILALTNSELTVLPADDYFRCVTKYPWLVEKHDSTRRAILAGNKSLDDFSYFVATCYGSDEEVNGNSGLGKLFRKLTFFRPSNASCFTNTRASTASEA
jgi:CRP-like cAMP-binding protein